MKVNLPTLRTKLQSNVCEIIFEKRRPKAGDSSQRRMLCTLDQNLLNSVNGRTTLNFKPANEAAAYNPAAKNLLCVWDIFMQSWRMVNMDNCNLVKSIPRDDFWEYFNTNIYTMTTEQKNQFMGR